jgi:inner membrane protein
MKFALLAKGVSLFAVIVLLSISLQMIGSVADERMRYREQAAASIRQSLAGPQTVAGPIVTRACLQTVETVTETPKGKVFEKTEQSLVLKSLPQSVKWSVAGAIEPRYRGLYKVNSYRIEATADVAWTSLEELATPSVKSPVIAVRCAEPHIEFAVTDARGIRSIKLDWKDGALKPEPMSGSDVFTTGFTARPSIADAQLKDAQQLRIAMQLVGVESLSFVPLGNENLVEMTSDWPHPSFAGAFLPTERAVNEKGFQSKWSVSSLASNARAGVARGDTLCVGMAAESDPSYAVQVAAAATKQKSCLQSFGVNFIDPINPSSLSDRATKYAILFIALTFVGLVLLEVVKEVRVHPIQYLLIGAALAVFFLLLLSLSEHVSFGLAYLIAAIACMGLIGVYAKAALGGWSRAGSTMAGLGVLYAVLYVVLQSEQHALLAGSLLIFAALAGVMLLTRGVNWSAFGAKVAASTSMKHATTTSNASNAKPEAV